MGLRYSKVKETCKEKFNILKRIFIATTYMLFRLCKNNLLNIVVIIISVAGLIVSIQVLNIEKTNQEIDRIAFFKYEYDDDKQLFKVTSENTIDIIRVDWLFLEKSYLEEEYGLAIINSLDKNLTKKELINHYAWSIGYSYNSNEWERDVIECEFFRQFVETGIPVLVKTTYANKKESNLINYDIVLLSRLDTTMPNPRVIERDVTNLSINNFFFSKHLENFKNAIEYVKETYGPEKTNYNKGSLRVDGKCFIIENQPPEGL